MMILDKYLAHDLRQDLPTAAPLSTLVGRGRPTLTFELQADPPGALSSDRSRRWVLAAPPIRAPAALVARGRAATIRQSLTHKSEEGTMVMTPRTTPVFSATA